MDWTELLGISLLLWVYVATSIKRPHDGDKSGWWMVPFFVIPGLYKQFDDRLPDSYFTLLPEGLAKDQPVRRRPVDAAASARYAAALGSAKRDRNGAAQGWPAAGLAC